MNECLPGQLAALLGMRRAIYKENNHLQRMATDRDKTSKDGVDDDMKPKLKHPASFLRSPRGRTETHQRTTRKRTSSDPNEIWLSHFVLLENNLCWIESQ
ncbi:hypothetical protein OUZ56_008738 [Daphnia magna]|uniref:Uncharacterized protein n=1 Tax=Daphnia magna TaxID=35525 RepID=A0ABR0ADX4_9CRUS|nr:hypothetical protein OUZ56_008738 [Daphnia magna]